MAETSVYYRFLIRAYTTDEWASGSVDPVLKNRELGVELDNTTGKPIGCKFGDGSTPWPDLDYVVLGLGEVDLDGLADGDTLVYNASTGKWSPGAGGGGGTADMPAVMARISMRC